MQLLLKILESNACVLHLGRVCQSRQLTRNMLMIIDQKQAAPHGSQPLLQCQEARLAEQPGSTLTRKCHNRPPAVHFNSTTQPCWQRMHPHLHSCKSKQQAPARVDCFDIHCACMQDSGQRTHKAQVRLTQLHCNNSWPGHPKRLKPQARHGTIFRYVCAEFDSRRQTLTRKPCNVQERLCGRSPAQSLRSHT